MTNKRIDSLAPDTLVSLIFHPNTTPEAARFLGIEGDGEHRQAKFRSLDANGKVYEWQAYRYVGRWAYGTGADRLSLNKIEEEA